MTLGRRPDDRSLLAGADDADTSAPFYIVHFDALDRDYEGAADEQLKENPAEKLEAGCILVAVGKNEDLNKFRKPL